MWLVCGIVLCPSSCPRHLCPPPLPTPVFSPLSLYLCDCIDLPPSFILTHLLHPSPLSHGPLQQDQIIRRMSTKHTTHTDTPPSSHRHTTIVTSTQGALHRHALILCISYLLPYLARVICSALLMMVRLSSCLSAVTADGVALSLIHLSIPSSFSFSCRWSSH